MHEKYEGASEYIEKLPTMEDYDRISTNLVKRMKTIAAYKQKDEDAAARMLTLQQNLDTHKSELHRVKERENSYKSKIGSLTERIKQCEDREKIDTKETDGLKEKVERFKNEALQTWKLIDEEKTKATRMMSTYQSKINELKSKLQTEAETVDELRSELKTQGHSNIKLNIKLDLAEKSNQRDKDDFKEQLQHIESTCIEKVHNLFPDLLKNVLCCCREFNVVSKSLEKIARHEDLQLELLFLSHDLDDNDVCLKLNSKNLQDHIQTVTEARQRIVDVNNAMMEHLTDTLAADIKFCVTQ